MRKVKNIFIYSNKKKNGKNDNFSKKNSSLKYSSKCFAINYINKIACFYPLLHLTLKKSKTFENLRFLLSNLKSFKNKLQSIEIT